MLLLLLLPEPPGPAVLLPMITGADTTRCPPPPDPIDFGRFSLLAVAPVVDDAGAVPSFIAANVLLGLLLSTSTSPLAPSPSPIFGGE